MQTGMVRTVLLTLKALPTRGNLPDVYIIGCTIGLYIALRVGFLFAMLKRSTGGIQSVDTILDMLSLSDDRAGLEVAIILSACGQCTRLDFGSITSVYAKTVALLNELA